MNVRSRQLVRLLLLLVATVVPHAGFAQLNPTVKVLPRATTPVPPECAEGVTAPPVVRLPPEERDFVVRETAKDMEPPPSATLRGELQHAFEAAQRNDRDAFHESLSRAKKLLAGYPPGGERSAGENTIAVLDEIDKLWEFLFTSRTGSFFETAGDVHRTMAKYPGYETFIRRQTIVDQNGVKFYPTHESRDFLIQQASVPYARLTGKRLPVIPETRRAAVAPPPPPQPRTTHVVKPKPAPKLVHHEARATTTPRRVRRKATPPPPTPTPAPPPPATTTHAVTTPTPVAPPPSTATELPPATATSTTASTTTEAPTTTTAAPATTETTEPAKKGEEKKGRNFLVPALLILVGIGVLVVLFRSSS